MKIFDKKGKFLKGHGFWKGKKRPGFSNSGTFKKGDVRLIGNKINVGRSPPNKGIPMSDKSKKKMIETKKKNYKHRYKKCKQCGEDFSLKGKKNDNKFCCSKCYWRYLKGRPGKSSTKFTSKNNSGKNHYNWKGGITPLNLSIRSSIKMKKWRESVFKRDNYTCVECGGKPPQVVLHCDHIIPVSQGGTDELSNLQTLCEQCNLSKSNSYWESIAPHSNSSEQSSSSQSEDLICVKEENQK